MSVQPPPLGRMRRVRRHPVTRTVVTLLLFFLAYRVLFVYKIRGGDCLHGMRLPIHSAGRVAARQPLPGRQHLTVLTYNIEGHAALLRSDHLQQLAKVINDSNADIIALQEVHRHSWQARFADQARALAELTHRNYVYAPSFSAFGGEFGNALLTRGEIRGAERIDLPSFGEPRSLLIAQLVVDRRPLTFFVVHLAAWERLNASIRTKEVDCIRSKLSQTRGDLMIAGDFNASPTTTEIAHLRATPQIRIANPLDAPTHRILHETIDFIGASPSILVVSSRVLAQGPSDHWPVVAEYEWPGKE